ncbi:hypothetical protein [Myxococcus sp. CA040A]|uniref:hypothetical protein n=1 Tax=Myxococcus sp. CA040A TaxID=2741738 RepID=UPI00157A7E82|nr:hypothetical protein [Myxococcus sp. CA040A]NTX08976.1 hypothetical protein [Myxococcus sp. CA040A]
MTKYPTLNGLAVMRDAAEQAVAADQRNSPHLAEVRPTVTVDAIDLHSILLDWQRLADAHDKATKILEAERVASNPRGTPTERVLAALYDAMEHQD